MLGVWQNPARLLIVRSSNPLWFGQTGAGYYFGSLPDELPGAVTPIRDNYSGVLVHEGSELWHEAYSIGR